MTKEKTLDEDFNVFIIKHFDVFIIMTLAVFIIGGLFGATLLNENYKGWVSGEDFDAWKSTCINTTNEYQQFKDGICFVQTPQGFAINISNFTVSKIGTCKGDENETIVGNKIQPQA